MDKWGREVNKRLQIINIEVHNLKIFQKNFNRIFVARNILIYVRPHTHTQVKMTNKFLNYVFRLKSGIGKSVLCRIDIQRFSIQL